MVVEWWAFLMRLKLVFLWNKVKILDEVGHFLSNFMDCGLFFVVDCGDFFDNSLEIERKLLIRGLFYRLFIHIQTTLAHLNQPILQVLQPRKRVEKKRTDFGPQLFQKLFLSQYFLQVQVFLFFNILMQSVVIIL